MRIIEQLVYKIQGDNSEFDRSIDKSETKISKFGSVADKIFAGVTVAAIGMVVKKMGEMVISSATALDRVDKLSQKIGISRVAFQEWDYILGQSGASVEGLQMGVKTLSNAADEARKGTALYAEAFDRLGVSVTDANGNMKDQETLFAEVFSSLADMENQTERTALATKLLGRSATELAPTLNTSKEGIEQLRSEAHSLGLVYSDELVDAGVVLGDNIDRLKKSFEALKTNALAPIIGLAVTFTDKLLGQDSASKRLTDSTNNLASASDAYKTITSQLKNPIDNLTESEKALLEIQQKRAEIKLNQAIIELGKNYADTQRKISNLRNDEEKYQGTIEQSLAVINKYTPEQREEIRNYQQQGRTITDMLLKKRELLTAEGDLERAQINLLSTQGKLIDENGNFNASITQIAQGVIDQQVELSTLANINADFAESVRLQVEALQARDIALSDARKAFEDMKDGSNASLMSMIQAIEVQDKNVYSTELLRLATEELARRTEEKAIADAKATEEEKKLQEERQKAADEAIEMFNAESEARRQAYDKMAETRMSDKEKAFKAIQEQADAYLKAGVSIADVAKWQSEQIQKYQDEQTRKAKEEADKQKAIEEEKTMVEQEELEKRNQAILEAFNQSTKTRADAYKLLESYSLSERDKAIANIQAQADKFLEAGVSIVDVATWQKNELAKLQEEQADKAEEEAERVRKAWEDATFSMLGSVTSIWGSINQVQANANAQLIATLEKTTAETLKNIDKQTQAKLEAEGVALETTEERLIRERDEALATGDEITANLKAQEIRRNEIIAEADEEKRLIEEEANKRKIDMQIEEAERNKALSTLSVILDTAKAIMQIWANPLIAPWGKGLWTGLAAGAGAAQIAAINSAPVPSYDVGSIRIPETTTATVHKDEMILTAPQAEQARSEGITIAPTNRTSGTVPFVVQLDGREIARAMLDNINTGSVGTIKARVVK